MPDKAGAAEIPEAEAAAVVALAVAPTDAQATPVPIPPDPLPLALLALLPDLRWVGGAPLLLAMADGGPRSRPERDMCPPIPTPTPTPTPTPVEADSPSHDEYRSLAGATWLAPEAAVAFDSPRSAADTDDGGGRSNTDACDMLPLRSAC